MNKPNIADANIARISDKAGNFLMWAVMSSAGDKYYAVRCKKIGARCFWFCDCEAAKYGFHNCADGKCRHIKAVIAREKGRREQRIARKAFARLFADLVTMAQQQEAQAAIVEVERIVAPWTGKHTLSSENYRIHEQVCNCGAASWQGHYKAKFEAYQRESAVLNGSGEFRLLKK